MIPLRKNISSFYQCVKGVQIRIFFWSIYYRIWTKYGEIRTISPYSVRIWENKDQKKTRIWTLFTECVIYKIMPKENMKQEFRLKKIDEPRNCLNEEMNRNELMNKKPKKVCRILNYIDHSLIAIPTITGFVSISAFNSLVGIAIGITSSATGLKICAINEGIKKY